MLCETFLTPETPNTLVSLDGYDLVSRKDGRENQTRARGLLAYARVGLGVSELETGALESIKEATGLLVPWGKVQLNLVVIYRPPRAPGSELDAGNTEKICELMDNIKGKTVILGDLNLPNVDWDLLHSNSKGETMILDSVQRGFWTQHVDFTTHNQGNTLDVVLSNSPELVAGVTDLGPVGSSDHSAIMAEIHGPARVKETQELVPNWAKADWAGMGEWLGSRNWEELRHTSVEQAWCCLKNHLLDATTKFIPMKTRSTPNKPPWMTPKIGKLLRRKRKMWQVFRENRMESNRHEHIKATKKVKAAVKDAKRKYERRLAKEGKRSKKRFYSYLKKNLSNRVGIGPLKNGETMATNNKDMANILNECYAKVFTKETDAPDTHPEVWLAEEDHLSNIQFEEAAVKEKLQAIKTSSAPGPDKIWALVLNKMAAVLASPITTVFNTSMKEAKVPGDWKLANISPIYKKGSKSDPQNYRPIALTSIIGKVMEQIIVQHVTNHLDHHDIIRGSQHGFRRGRSTVTNLLAYLEDLTKAVDQGKNVDVLYIDFARAFDKVPHRKLISKVRGVGLSGAVLQWVEDWLSGRQQRVVIKGECSDWTDIKSGVIQGSCLGPLLFTIYINDIDNAVVGSGAAVHKFADDSKASGVVNNEEDRILFQHTIDQLIAWAEQWEMSFNKAKCHVMHFGRKNNRYQYKMGDSVLEPSSQEKDLGVLVSDNLRPAAQCAAAAKKANQVLGQLSRSVSYRDRETFLSLYISHVRPHLEYAVQAWCPWTARDIDLLESVQRRAIRMISGLSGSYEEKLTELGLPTLLQRRTRGDLVQVYKTIHGVDNVDTSTWFSMVDSRTGAANTRFTTDPLTISRPDARDHNETRYNFWSKRTVDRWNELPASVKTAASVTAFKTGLDAWNLENYMKTTSSNNLRTV